MTKMEKKSYIAPEVKLRSSYLTTYILSGSDRIKTVGNPHHPQGLNLGTGDDDFAKDRSSNDGGGTPSGPIDWDF